MGQTLKMPPPPTFPTMQLKSIFSQLQYMLFVISQDLLSFELLDINIVQELENVPNNTPAGKKRSSGFQLLSQEHSELVFILLFCMSHADV